MPDKLAAAAYLVDLINTNPYFGSYKIALDPLEKFDEIFSDKSLLKTASLDMFSELLGIIKQASGEEKTAEEIIEEKKSSLPAEYLKLLEKYDSKPKKIRKEAQVKEEEETPNNLLDISKAKKELINEILEKKAELEGLDGKKTIEMMKELEQKNITELTKMAQEINERYMMRYASIGEPIPSKVTTTEIDSFTEFLLSKVGQF